MDNFKSQCGQDKYLYSLIGNKKNGYFIELGACDGIVFSNSYFFEKELGWNGILIEPNPIYYNDLINNRNCHISNKLISNIENENYTFLDFSWFSGIISNDQYQSIHITENLNAHNKINLTSTTLEKVLIEFNAPDEIDFLSIDIEGQEYPILKTFPFNKYKIKYICVERNNAKEEIKKLMEDNNYVFINEDTYDDFYELKNK